METYRLTTRGKWVLGIFIFLLIVGMVYSGTYIIEYYSSSEGEVSINPPDDMTLETAESTELTEITETSQQETSEEPTDFTTEVDLEATTAYNETVETSEAQIYSPVEIEDLKQFKIIFYFDEGGSDNSIDQDELDALLAAIETYPNESIVIEGHANGYPNYEEDADLLRMSQLRSAILKERLLEAGVELGDLIVVDYGGEKPIHKSYGEQHLNNRVEVYFGDHFIHDGQGK